MNDALQITSYRASGAQGLLQSVDFSTVGGQQFAFFEAYDLAGLNTLSRWLAAPPLRQEIVAVTTVSGRPVVITRGQASPVAMLETLSQRGEALEPIPPHRSFPAWKVRSLFGFGGQTLQLISAFLRPTRQVDTSVLVFAASNLMANTINMVYKDGEQVEDKHQLSYLKQRINRELAPHLQPGQAVLDISDRRTLLREDAGQKRPIDEARGFLRRHSVAIGELGLRYFGALGLAFPVRYWKKAWQEKRFPPQMDSSVLRRYTGVSSILGKSVAMGSKIPDPYNPKPPTWLDNLRENVAFLTGGLIEITSFSALAYDSFFNSTGSEANRNRGLLIGGKHSRDWIGGIGASMFVLGYVVRLFAKFGERKVDMKELYAHASDTLAAATPEKTSQLLANTAASLAEHFESSSKLRFAEIYSNLVEDLTRQHRQVLASTAADVAQAADKNKELFLVVQPKTTVSTSDAVRGIVQAAAPLQHAVS
jgi:hypothetical protein